MLFRFDNNNKYSRIKFLDFLLKIIGYYAELERKAFYTCILTNTGIMKDVKMNLLHFFRLVHSCVDSDRLFEEDIKIDTNFQLNVIKNKLINKNLFAKMFIQRKIMVYMLDNFSKNVDDFAALYQIIKEMYGEIILRGQLSYFIFVFRSLNQQNRILERIDFKSVISTEISEYIESCIKCYYFSIEEANCLYDLQNRVIISAKILWLIEHNNCLMKFSDDKKTIRYLTSSWDDEIWFCFRIKYSQIARSKKFANNMAKQKKNYKNKFFIKSISIKTIKQEFEFVFLTTVTPYKKQPKNKSNYYKAILSVYCRRNLSLTLYTRFTYLACENGLKFIIVNDQNNSEYEKLFKTDFIKYKNFIENFRNLFKDAFLISNYVFLPFYNFLARYEILSDYHYPIIFFKNKKTKLKYEIYEGLKRVLNEFFKGLNYEITIFHSTFNAKSVFDVSYHDINEHTYKMRIIKELNCNDITKESFLQYKNLLINIKHVDKTNEKNISFVLPIQEQELLKTILEPEPGYCKAYSLMYIQKKIPHEFQIHSLYIISVIKHMIVNDSAFLNIKYRSKNIVNHFITRERINCAMLKYIITDCVLRSSLKKSFISEDYKNWTKLNLPYQELMKYPLYKPFNKCFVDNERFQKLQNFMLNFLSTRQIDYIKDNMMEYPERVVFILHDQNLIKDKSLYTLISKELKFMYEDKGPIHGSNLDEKWNTKNKI
ncbi:hypothetical protein COBT_002461 [Conglomerata obtusa]